MIRKLAAVVTLLFASWACMAEEFYLKSDRTGKTYGPFNSDGGSKVVLDNSGFTVVTKTPSAVEKKLSTIMIPEVDFRCAILPDVVTFLQTATVEFDPEHAGVNFVLAPSKEKSKPSGSAEGFDSDMAMTDLHSMVTVKLRNVSALDLLKAICEQSGHKYKISGKILTLYKD